MCAIAQSTPEHQGSPERPRIPILRTRVNKDYQARLRLLVDEEDEELTLVKALR
jgi:hypothetical protein